MADVSSNRLMTFLQDCPVRTFNKGEIIIFQGEAPRAAYVVKSGVVKAYNLSVNGDEKPVSFYSDQEIFPASWVYGKMPSAVYYYEAFTADVSVYLVNREDYIAFMKSQPELMFAELERLITNHLGQTMRLNALQHSRASDKLIYTLHYLALSQDFANLTGLTRETAATELNKLKHQGVISYNKHTPYQLHIDKLMSLLNDQYISDIQIKL
jgi:CRP-like cAMP-binding protein